MTPRSAHTQKAHLIAFIHLCHNCPSKSQISKVFQNLAGETSTTRRSTHTQPFTGITTSLTVFVSPQKVIMVLVKNKLSAHQPWPTGSGFGLETSSIPDQQPTAEVCLRRAPNPSLLPGGRPKVPGQCVLHLTVFTACCVCCSYSVMQQSLHLLVVPVLSCTNIE